MEYLNGYYIDQFASKVEILVHNCPNCRTENADMELVVEPIKNFRSENDVEFFLIYRCKLSSCKKLMFKKLTLGIEENGNTITSAQWTETSPMALEYEEILPELLNLDFQNSVCEDYKEALICKSINCYKAASVMLRRSLEGAVNYLLEKQGVSEEDLKKMKYLHKKIDELTEMPSRLKRRAHEIRFAGNSGAHPDNENSDSEDFSIENLENAFEFIADFFQSEFILPYKQEESENRRKTKKEEE